MKNTLMLPTGLRVNEPPLSVRLDMIAVSAEMALQYSRDTVLRRIAASAKYATESIALRAKAAEDSLHTKESRVWAKWFRHQRLLAAFSRPLATSSFELARLIELQHNGRAPF